MLLVMIEDAWQAWSKSGLEPTGSIAYAKQILKMALPFIRTHAEQNWPKVFHGPIEKVFP